MADTMRAALLERAGSISVRDVPRPTIGRGDVLIRVGRCGICGSDMHSYTTGMYVEPGQIMGHEFMGRVADLGGDVKGLSVGDRVTGFSASVCGECDACARGDFQLCSKLFTGSTGYGVPGAFAEYVKIENAELGLNVHKLPDRISDVSAAMVEPFSIGVSAVQRAGVKPGHRVVVLGVGMIGNACLQAARAVGATVLAVDVSSVRLAVARTSGADDVFDARDGGALEWVKAKFGVTKHHYGEGGSADVVFEAAGVPTTIRQSLDMIRPGGTICIVGLPEHETPIDTTRIVHKMPLIIGSLGGDFAATISQMEAGLLDGDLLCTHRFPLEQAAEAFEAQRNADKTIKVMIEMPPTPTIP